MAKLNINWRGYSYQAGLEVLAQSYLASQQALEDGIERAKDEAIGYQQAVEQGIEEPQIEYDDDGTPLVDHADVLAWNVDLAQEASMALRKAFVIAAYHHWERSARGWTGSQHGKHEKLVTLSREKGYPIHPRLEAIQQLVNLLKHDNAAWGEKVLVSWPEVISPSFKAKPATDWYEAVSLRSEQVVEVLDALTASGPHSTMMPKDEQPAHK